MSRAIARRELWVYGASTAGKHAFYNLTTTKAVGVERSRSVWPSAGRAENTTLACAIGGERIRSDCSNRTEGLIARELEAAGIPTLCMTSALDNTRSVNPPRAAFLDYPLGHTTGKPNDADLQRRIMREALAGFESMTMPGSVKMLPFA